MKLKSTVGGVHFPDIPIMIGAGACKTYDRTLPWLKVIATVSGSYTPLPRSGNDGNKKSYPDTFQAMLKQGGLNAYGMPNAGYQAAATAFDDIESSYPLIISVAGFNPREFIEGIEMFSLIDGVSAVEANLGCPNTDHDSIMSFSMSDIMALLEMVNPTKPLWLKLSPYSDPALLRSVAELVNEYRHKVAAVVTCNTFPDAYLPDAIDANDGKVGLSGPPLHSIALGQVRAFRKHLCDDIDVIGVGGVVDGHSLMDMFESGANGIQMTSLAHWAGDPGRLFDQLSKDGQLGLLWEENQ